MDGSVVARAIYAGDTEVTSIVGNRIVADDALPQGTNLPAILIKMVSLVDRNILKPGSKQHVRERVQTEAHGRTARERRELRLAMRRAVFANRFPTVEGLSRVTADPMTAGPDFLSQANVRVGIQDLFITYSQER